MTLLQAAYSHYGIAKEYQPGTDGVFRSVVTSNKVTSQIQITHSVHDIAVGLAYPVASAIARQIGEGLWINPFGGMGGDGAQSTTEAFSRYTATRRGDLLFDLEWQARAQSQRRRNYYESWRHHARRGRIRVAQRGVSAKRTMRQLQAASAVEPSRCTVFASMPVYVTATHPVRPRSAPASTCTRTRMRSASEGS